MVFSRGVLEETVAWCRDSLELASAVRGVGEGSSSSVSAMTTGLGSDVMIAYGPARPITMDRLLGGTGS